MSEQGKETGECYGILEKVFPVGEGGLREVAPACQGCPQRVSCLKNALATRDGLELRNEIIDRAASAGLMGRLQRWSRKKELNRLMREQKAKKG